MKLHRMNAEIAVQGISVEKVMKPIQILADPTEAIGIYKDNRDGRYIVSHIPSGYKITGTQTQRAAREAIVRLLALGIDWHETDPDKLRGSLSGPAHGSVIEIIKDYRGR